MSVSPKAVYDQFYKADHISLAETIVRLNMLADFIEKKSGFLGLRNAHRTSIDQSGRKESLTECSIIEWAAQEPNFNAKGLWMTEKNSTDPKDFVPSPYPHFKTFYTITFDPTAKTKEEANKSFNKYTALPVFFGVHPYVYQYLTSSLHYEYGFALSQYTLIEWLKGLQIPEVYWTSLDVDLHDKFFRFKIGDMVTRIRFFVDLLEKSPLTSTYEATYNILDFTESDLKCAANKMSNKIKKFMKKQTVFHFFANFAKSA